MVDDVNGGRGGAGALLRPLAVSIDLPRCVTGRFVQRVVGEATARTLGPARGTHHHPRSYGCRDDTSWQVPRMATACQAARGLLNHWLGRSSRLPSLYDAHTRLALRHRGLASRVVGASLRRGDPHRRYRLGAASVRAASTLHPSCHGRRSPRRGRGWRGGGCCRRSRLLPPWPSSSKGALGRTLPGRDGFDRRVPGCTCLYDPIHRPGCYASFPQSRRCPRLCILCTDLRHPDRPELVHGTVFARSRPDGPARPDAVACGVSSCPNGAEASGEVRRRKSGCRRRPPGVGAVSTLGAPRRRESLIPPPLPFPHPSRRANGVAPGMGFRRRWATSHTDSADHRCIPLLRASA